MPAFDYPAACLERKHGPRGYADSASYRPWLRDEFTFRCVYCLIREQWGRVTAEFDIDHFVAQATDSYQVTKYDNLIYSCARCNAIKAAEVVPDPMDALIVQNIRIGSDGSVESYSNGAAEIVLKLDLNSPEMISWRLLWIRIIELARDYDAKLFERLQGFPDDLPDLSRLRPPGGNSRPGGVSMSYFSLAARRDLPALY